MTVKVRKATDDDGATLVEFNLALASESEGKTLDPDRVRAGVDAVFDDPTKGTFFIAEFGGRRAGSLLITTEWSDWENAYYWWIQSVYVLPELRGKGIYKALYRHVQDLARSNGRVRGFKLYVERDNRTAKTVYEKLGMIRAAHDIYETPDPIDRNPREND